MNLLKVKQKQKSTSKKLKKIVWGEKMEENKEHQARGLALFQKRVIELCKGDKDKAKVMQQMADLQGDFDFVKDLNEQLAAKYDDLCSSFPFAKELDILTVAIKKDKGKSLGYNEQKLKERLFQLGRFKSALEHLEMKDATFKPPKYDDIKGDVKE